jgi:hypothetical protein
MRLESNEISLRVLVTMAGLRLVKLSVMMALLLSACAGVDPQRFAGPNGGTAYSMRCSGFGRDWDDCYKAAGELCPAGYAIINQGSGVVGVPTAAGFVIAPKQTLAIECKS